MIASPGSVEAQRAFILGDPKPEADVGNLARPITDVVSSPHRKRGMTVRGMGLVAVDRGERPLRVRCGPTKALSDALNRTFGSVATGPPVSPRRGGLTLGAAAAAILTWR